MEKNLKILFLGDLVGRPGRHGVEKFLEENKEKYDLVIANVENASHGFGLTEKNYGELSSYGIDIMTSGNHIWDRKDIFKYIESADKLLRPINYPEGTPGKGSKIFDLGENIKIGVINVLGTVFMPPIISPWDILAREISIIKEITPIVIIDFHAEATAEKISCSVIASEKSVSALIGSHTHVQTADEKIIGQGTAYITDAGFCGSYNSVIGMDTETSVYRLVKMLPSRLEVGPGNLVQINGVEMDINPVNGYAERIERICRVLEMNNEVN